MIDQAVEEHLTEALTALPPAAPIVGEEAAHAKPELLEALAGDAPLWLLAPIDGTRNFARGEDGFGIMLAWVVRGHARAARVVLPARGQLFAAEAGGGARLNGMPVVVPPPRADAAPRGAVLGRYMPAPLRDQVRRATEQGFRAVPDSGCAAVEYTEILRGERDFAIYHRLLAWDHAAPALILTEAGGRVEHLDGAPYSVRSGHQLTIVARDSDRRVELRARRARPRYAPAL